VYSTKGAKNEGESKGRLKLGGAEGIIEDKERERVKRNDRLIGLVRDAHAMGKVEARVSLLLFLGEDGVVELRKRRKLLLVDQLELQTR
jgi:hypothetical protein